MDTNETTFSINVSGEGDAKYLGEFKMRLRLSHFQSLRKDELRRELLGTNPQFAPDEVFKSAYILSTCAAYIIDGPKWWLNSNSGRDLLDEEPVAAVFEQIEKNLKARQEAMEARAKQDKEELAK